MLCVFIKFLMLLILVYCTLKGVLIDLVVYRDCIKEDKFCSNRQILRS